MTIKEKIIQEIDSIDPVQLHLIYDIISNIKNKSRKQNQKNNNSHLKVRNALKSVKGSLSSEIIKNREDRI
ncbi:MAG: hypothetical protein KDK36_09020 [Leptospiraceae bacterium]|nr:hypothetical protein [Leptospiraceae bacterium]